MSTNHFVEITATQTHIVVTINQRLVLHIADAQSVSINGIALTQVSVEQQLWMWHTQRRIGRHLLMIVRDTSVQIVSIECVAESAYHEVIFALRNMLSAIDMRLCAGQSALQPIEFSHATFASLMGMTVESFVRLLARFTQTPLPLSLNEWNGDGPVQLRMDRVVVRDAAVVPFVYQTQQQPHDQTLIMRLLDILQMIDRGADHQIHEAITQIRYRLMSPFNYSHEFVDLVTKADYAISQCQRVAVHGELRQTADVALLYERWVWVVVLRALGCTDDQVRQLIHDSRDFCSDVGVMCAYQRRLATTPHATGWSRDGRVAVPDVLLWQAVDSGGTRMCIIDAKCSFGAHRPDQTAQNDVTAYLRRVGVGDSDPEFAVLVHPGHGVYQWPSGLVEIGTRGIVEDELVAFVRAWGLQQI